MRRTRKARKGGLFTALSRQEGTMSVEMVIMFPVLVLVVLGVLEFGHLWHVRHTLTIATREGARTAVVFHVGDDRETWARQTARDTVDAYLRRFWTDGTWTVPEPTVTLGPTGTLVGGTLRVQVQGTNALLVLHRLVNDIPVVAETTMRFE